MTIDPRRLAKADPGTTEDDEESRAEKWARRAEKALAALILAVLLGRRRAFANETVRAAILAGRWREVLDAARIPEDDEEFRAAWRRLWQVFSDAADKTTIDVAAKLGRAALVFDPTHADAAAAMTARRTALLRFLNESNVEGLTEALSVLFQRGLTPVQIAEILPRLVGLTPQAALAVLRYGDGLTTAPSGELLDRALRDRRFDASILQAIRSGQALDAERANRILDRYAERQLAYRASLISGKEAMVAAVLGVRAAWSQAMARVRPGTEVRRFWHVVRDERLCWWCAPIPLMNPDGVPLDGHYQTPTGPVSGPEQSHPSCRCWEEFSA